MAEPLLVPKLSDPGGSCLHGYLASGSYRVSAFPLDDETGPPPHPVPG
jgi:hypothetical protein